MAKAKKVKKVKQKRSKSRMLLYIVGFIMLIIALSFAAVLFTLGMLPSFVASYVDTTKERNHFRVVAACNFAGVLPYIMGLLRKGEITSDRVYDLIFTPHVWLVMYGAAGFGWLLVWFFPKMVHFILNSLQDSSVASLYSKQQDIVDEWGIEVETTADRALRNAAFSDSNKRKNTED
ncbi:MAG: hypothetical protein MK052_05280 [Alphaproteobacteria bacterium]|nr:hypothetical protein [Alphaproteobacteria bacterium]